VLAIRIQQAGTADVVELAGQAAGEGVNEAEGRLGEERARRAGLREVVGCSRHFPPG